MGDLGKLLYRFSLRVSMDGKTITVKFKAKEYFTHRMTIDALRRLARALKEEHEGELSDDIRPH